MKLNFKCINVDLQDGEPASECVALRAIDEGVSGTLELTLDNKEQQGQFKNDEVYELVIGDPEKPEDPAPADAPAPTEPADVTA